MPVNLPVLSSRVDLEDMRSKLGADDELLGDSLTPFLEEYPATSAALEHSGGTRDKGGRAAARTHSREAWAICRLTRWSRLPARSKQRRCANTRAPFDSLFTNLAREIGALAAELTGTSPERL